MYQIILSFWAFCPLLPAVAWTAPRDINVPLHSTQEIEALQPYKVKFPNGTWLYQRGSSCPLTCPNGEAFDPDTPLCATLCAPEEGQCSAQNQNQKRKQKQYIAPKDQWINSSLASLHTNATTETEKHSLYKRFLFTKTMEEISIYLPYQTNPGMFGNSWDPYFEKPEIIRSRDGRGTSRQVLIDQNDPRSARKPFQMGMNGVNGCTVVVIVSNRAVYMVHFYEWPAFTCLKKDFQNVVLAWFDLDYSPPPGDSYSTRLDPEKYTANDNTRVYIMTPRRLTSDPNSSQYFRRITLIKESIKKALNWWDVPIVLYNYHRWQRDTPGLGFDARGSALFQWDIDARGPGMHGWRLYFEYNTFQDTDPTPSFESSFGIPDWLAGW